MLHIHARSNYSPWTPAHDRKFSYFRARTHFRVKDRKIYSLTQNLPRNSRIYNLITRLHEKSNSDRWQNCFERFKRQKIKGAPKHSARLHWKLNSKGDYVIYFKTIRSVAGSFAIRKLWTKKRRFRWNWGLRARVCARRFYAEDTISYSTGHVYKCVLKFPTQD